MTKVISLASRKASQITTPTTGNTPPLARQFAIENALSMALFYVRQNEAPSNIHAATVKAVRAASLLKQASAEITTEGGAA